MKQKLISYGIVMALVLGYLGISRFFSKEAILNYGMSEGVIDYSATGTDITDEVIGKDNYVYQIAKKAKEFKAPQSNLFKDLNSLIKYIGIAIIPIGILTFLKEFTVAGSTIVLF